MRGVYNIYFSASRSPLRERLLVLNGEGRGVINNLVVPSDVAPRYSPSGAALISITVLEQSAAGRALVDLAEAARREAREWFGPEVDGWRYLKGFHIARALPVQNPPYVSVADREPPLVAGVYRCGG